MRWILFLLSAPAILLGFGDTMAATTVFQQIAGLLSLLIGAVLFGAAAVVDASVDLKRQLKKLTREADERQRIRQAVSSEESSIANSQ